MLGGVWKGFLAGNDGEASDSETGEEPVEDSVDDLFEHETWVDWLRGRDLAKQCVLRHGHPRLLSGPSLKSGPNFLQ